MITTNEPTILLQGITVSDFLQRVQESIASPAPAIQDEQMNVKQAAAFLKLSVPTIWRLKLQGKIPYKQIGSRVVFIKSELAIWLKNQ